MFEEVLRERRNREAMRKRNYRRKREKRILSWSFLVEKTSPLVPFRPSPPTRTHSCIALGNEFMQIHICESITPPNVYSFNNSQQRGMQNWGLLKLPPLSVTPFLCRGNTRLWHRFLTRLILILDYMHIGLHTGLGNEWY